MEVEKEVGAKVLEEMEVEPWEPIESKLVKWTVVTGIIAMIILAALVQTFILKHY
ncbi:hypothetical protein [Archaeoglobus veneficus]|uniref:Preprotein translocase subunit SecE n=1 Tax=Archaeoglobus veneficus (strain DSM 11195 / SNP6) TaxID=693661 RepID=F2KMI9_ARCVS|nr:hypothetical protein [Archaeoglobus veneficus]AEA47186.1 hypothetical protein Arcve_1178 [Archaeoglobus veneficus SNP6]